MKEFVGKLIERLEKLSGEAEQNMNYCEELSLEDESYNVPASVSRKKYEAYQEVLNIAIQLAEEYTDKDCSECSRRKWYQIGYADAEKKLAEEYKDKVIIDGQYCWQTCCTTEHCKECNRLCNGSIDYYENYDVLSEEYNNGWIPCSERMPEVETKVLIHAKRKYRDGTFRDILTTAMYEDGTVLENDSIWRWEDIDGKWDEENDCYIIPEGWWEAKMYNADGELNHAVDDEVIEWQPLPALYQPKGE